MGAILGLVPRSGNHGIAFSRKAALPQSTALVCNRRQQSSQVTLAGLNPVVCNGGHEYEFVLTGLDLQTVV
jgi:hypothetical protein